MQKQQDALAKERKQMVGSGDRSEKIRTYNFPQNRLTDHRIGFTIHQLEQVMDGKSEADLCRATVPYESILDVVVVPGRMCRQPRIGFGTRA